MGINGRTGTALAYLRKSNIVPDEIFCLGHPELFASRPELKRISDGFNLGWSDDTFAEIKSAEFADTFLRKLGFSNIRTMDVSDFEGADVIHDLNQPLPEELRNSVSFLYDGGTMEHIFDVATAFRNVFALLKVGGIVMFNSPANGQCGHGFYQFSPEFYHRLLQANGFDHIQVYIVSIIGKPRWYRAIDPLVARRRVEFMSAEPLQLIVLARKSLEMNELILPKQSDYSEIAWKETTAERGAKRQYHMSPMVQLRNGIQHRILYPLQIILRHVFGRALGTGMPGLWRRSLFEPIEPVRDKLF